jgi:ubiquinone biosynthesis protein COQ4
MDSAQTTRLLDSLASLLREPARLDHDFVFGDGLDDEGLDAVLAAFRASEHGTRAVRERTRLGPISLPRLRVQSPGTLGHALATHLDRAGIDPAATPPLPARDAHEYVRAHLVETHHVWHTVTGFDADPDGELGLQAFTLAQVPVRPALLLLGVGLLQTVVHAFEEHGLRVDELARGWALGKRSRSLLGVDWKTMWATPLSQVRDQLGIEPRSQPHPAEAV